MGQSEPLPHRPACKPHSVRRFSTAWVVIYLGCASPRSSRSLPGIYAPSLEQGNEQLPARRGELPPCLALLPVGVAWPSPLLGTPVVSYTTFSPLPETGGMSLWPDPAGHPAPGITRHSALRSADFPRPWRPGPRPPGQPVVIRSYPDYLPASIISICRRIFVMRTWADIHQNLVWTGSSSRRKI
jgi:hypothetical protein